jgi:large subunit ribosomal protein L23
MSVASAKGPYDIVKRPRITERTVALSYGNDRLPEEKIQRQYTFEVAIDANKIQIKEAVEAIYNVGRKDSEKVEIDKVRTIRMKGKSRRVGQRSKGHKPDWKKAIVTLMPGQLLEDFGV